MLSALAKRLRAFAEKDGRGYPDWAARYLPLVRRLKPRLKPCARILEIGANENGFSRFAGVPVVAVDIAIDHLKAARAAQNVAPVVADGTALPFAEGQFDAIVCVDTFEHMTKDARRSTVREIRRVLTDEGIAVVTFPAPGAIEAEARIRDHYRAHTGGAIRWLEEHTAEDLPDPCVIADEFRANLNGRHVVAQSKNLNLRVWEGMWLVLMCGWPGRGNSLAQAALRVAAPVLSRCHFGQCYRAEIWIEPAEGSANPGDIQRP